MMMNAITRDAGPPVERAAPDVTKRPVPASRALVPHSSLSILLVESRVCSSRRRTDGASDRNHLHVARFQLPGQARVGGVGGGSGMVKVAAGDGLLLLSDGGIRVAPEAVDEARRPGRRRPGSLVPGLALSWRTGRRVGGLLGTNVLLGVAPVFERHGDGR